MLKVLGNKIQYAAFDLSLAFLHDSLSVFFKCKDRPDYWVIALYRACCELLRETAIKDNNSMLSGRTLAVGVLATLSTFIWPSAAFPIIAVSIFLSALEYKRWVLYLLPSSLAISKDISIQALLSPSNLLLKWLKLFPVSCYAYRVAWEFLNYPNCNRAGGEN